MSTDALGYTLALLVIGMSFVAVRYRNMLLTLGAAALWATLLAYIIANTTAGTNWMTLFIPSVVAFLAAFALISFFGRRRSEESNGNNFFENFTKFRDNSESESKSPTRGRGVMDLSPEEYRAYVHAKMRRK